MSADIIAAALIGAVGGGVGGLLGALLDKLLSRGKAASPRKFNIGAVIGVVVGMTTLNATDLRDRLARAAPQLDGREIVADAGEELGGRGLGELAEAAPKQTMEERKS